MCKYKGGKPACIMKVTVVGSLRGAQSAGQHPSGERSECEHKCWDPLLAEREARGKGRASVYAFCEISPRFLRVSKSY